MVIEGLFALQWFSIVVLFPKNEFACQHPLISTGVIVYYQTNTKEEKREIEYEENPLRLVARS